MYLMAICTCRTLKHDIKDREGIIDEKDLRIHDLKRSNEVQSIITQNKTFHTSSCRYPSQ